MKRIKKPNLCTFEEALQSEGVYYHGEHVARLSKSGYITIIKEGISRLYGSVKDAWRAL